MTQKSYNERFSNGILSGAAAISEQFHIGNLLDLAKLEKQRSTYKSYYQIKNEIFKNGVLKGMTLGMFPWGILMYSGRGIFYGTSLVISKDYLDNIKFDQKILNNVEEKATILSVTKFMGGLILFSIGCDFDSS